MKRNDLIKKVKSFGCVLIRHGANHDIYHNPNTGMTQPIPRHREVNEYLAKKIIRDLSND